MVLGGSLRGSWDSERVPEGLEGTALEVVVEGLGAVLAVLEEFLHPPLVTVRDGMIQGLPAQVVSGNLPTVLRIPDPDFSIPDPMVKKAPDP